MSTTNNQESDAWAKVVDLAAQIAEACGPVAHWGDGNCGAVINEVQAALQAKGLLKDRARSFASSKKPISQPLRTQVFERDLYRCQHCDTHLNLTVDHIKAESKGGSLDVENLQTLCRSCNSKKGAK